MPFVIVCSLISAGYWLARYMRKRNSLKVLVGKLMLIVIPLMGVGASWMLFAALNYHYYGVFLVNDYMEGSFSDFASEAIKVDAGDSEDGVWITRADLDDIIENSPTLQTIEPELRAAWDGWAGGGSPAQIRGDICWWAFRTGYSDAGGFTDARETQHFWANAADELEHAFSDGKLKEKNGFYLSKSTQPVTGGSVIPWLKHTAFFMFKLSSSDTILDNVGINSPYQYGSNPDNSDFDWLRFVETISPGRVAGEEGDVAAEKSKVFLELNSFVASVAYCLWCILGVLCLPCCIMLIWRLIKKNEVQGLITFLLVAVSMLLSALAVVMVNAWFTEFFWVNGTLDSVTESMAGYAIGYYPLIEMMICTIIGLSCQKFFVEKVCFESRRN